MREYIRLVESLFEPAPRAVLREAALPVISPQQARDRNMFGPVFHGTADIAPILSGGFDAERSANAASNGYSFQPYAPGATLPAPRHHLGFGIYFTTVRAIAKRFNHGTAKGLKEFWLDLGDRSRFTEINFGSPNTMMRWWRANGYDPDPMILRNRDVAEWTRATRHLTETLKAKYDAVWFIGKGIRRLLDGDQLVVFEPRIIHLVDPKLATGLEVGAKVVHTQQPNEWSRNRNDVYIDDITDDARLVGWKGYFRVIDHDGNEIPPERRHAIHKVPPPGMVGVIQAMRAGPSGPLYDVKWAKGGVQHNYHPNELAPAKR